MSQRAVQAFHEALLEDDPTLLYEQAPCGYISTTPEGRIVKVNATFCTWLGLEPEELLDRNLVDLLTAGGRIYHETHYAPMLRMQGFVREIAVDILCGDGSRLPVLLNASLVRSPDGDPRLVRVAVFDATERRSYERELVRARDAALAAEARATALVHTLQGSLIPPTPPAVPGLEVAARYRPAGDGTEVGGDFYDVFPAGPADWVITLGDVSGKGVEAAVVTSLVRNTARALTVLGHELAEVLHGVDEVVRHHQTDRFCTMVVVRFRRDGERWRGTIAVGGHPPALLFRPGAAPQMIDVTGPMVGVLPEVTFHEEQLDLRPGDTLLLYTDGVTEARGAGGYFDDERLLEWARQHDGRDPSVLVDSLMSEVVAFQDGRPRDDIAVLAIRHP